MGAELIPDTAGAPVTIVGTVPISAAALPLPAGASTEATLATLLARFPAAGASEATLAALSAKLPAALVGGRLDVNIGAPATLPISAAALPLPAGASTEATLAAILAKSEVPATLTQVVTGGANAIATATLPAVAGQFHYITHISIRRVATALLAGGAILAVTTTNLGGRSWRTGNQASITVDTMDGGVLLEADYAHPIKSAVANTATTIVCPAAGAAVSWQIVVDYYAAA